MKLISVMFSNILGFDGIIWLVAIFNTLIFLSVKKISSDIYNKMHLMVFAPHGKNSEGI